MNKAIKCPKIKKNGQSSEIKSRNYMCKKVAIVGLFQVQNHYNKLFEKH